MATKESLLQEKRIEKSQYERFFRWHTEKLSALAIRTSDYISEQIKALS